MVSLFSTKLFYVSDALMSLVVRSKKSRRDSKNWLCQTTSSERTTQRKSAPGAFSLSSALPVQRWFLKLFTPNFLQPELNLIKIHCRRYSDARGNHSTVTQVQFSTTVLVYCIDTLSFVGSDLGYEYTCVLHGKSNVLSNIHCIVFRLPRVYYLDRY
jgi:hypothetical protein